MDKRKGRVTIGDDGRVIGTGGNVNSNEYNVERNGNVIGTTFAQEVHEAYINGRKLKYIDK